MNTPSPSAPAAARPLAGTDQPRGRRHIAGLWTLAIFAWKYLAGMLFCCGLFLAAAGPEGIVARVFVRMILAPLVSVVVVGWTFRLMQRTAFKRWWRRAADDRRGATFEEFAAQAPATAEHRHWPNWLVPQNVRDRLAERPGPGARLWWFFTAPVRGLWRNTRLGVQAVFNTWVLTMPACGLWLFAWYDGWNNSFHKGYEQFWVGPLTGWLGVMLFIAAMMYVPLAQARQAAGGDWRAFYDFRLVRRLIRRRRLSCLGLALAYALAALPVTVLRMVPAFQEQAGFALFQNRETPAAMIDALNQYALIAAGILFPLFVGLHLLAARIYAGAVLGAVRDGELEPDELGNAERFTLSRLGLLAPAAGRTRPLLVRGLKRTGRGAAALLTGTAAVLVWFTFVAQIFVAEFFNYHPFLGWLNQPLVHLPWLHYVPLHLF